MGYPELIRAVVINAIQEAHSRRTPAEARLSALDWLQGEDCDWYCSVARLPFEDIQLWAQKKKREMRETVAIQKPFEENKIMKNLNESEISAIAKAIVAAVSDLPDDQQQAEPAPSDYESLQALIRQQVRDAAGIKPLAHKPPVNLDAGILPANISNADLADLIKAQVLETMNGGK